MVVWQRLPRDLLRQVRVRRPALRQQTQVLELSRHVQGIVRVAQLRRRYECRRQRHEPVRRGLQQRRRCAGPAQVLQSAGEYGRL